MLGTKLLGTIPYHSSGSSSSSIAAVFTPSLADFDIVLFLWLVKEFVSGSEDIPDGTSVGTDSQDGDQKDECPGILR